MKKLFFVLLAFFLIPSVFAISLDLKENYAPRETMIVKIDGNFLDPIVPGNVFFYSGRQLIALEYDVAKIDDSFYIYAILPNIERNYTLVIKNAHYFELGKEKTEELRYNFSVSGNISDFTIKPGFVITSIDFPITLESNTDRMTVDIKYQTYSTSVEVLPYKIKSYTIPLIYSPTATFLEIISENTAYKIPVKSLSYPKKPKSISFTNIFYNFTIYRGSQYPIKLVLSNKGSDAIRDIEISSDDEFDFVPITIPVLEPNSIIEINITAPLDTLDTNVYAESDTDDVEAETRLLVNVLSLNIEETPEEEISKHSCKEFYKGDLCEENEECSGVERTDTLEGKCCIGECKEKVSIGRIIIILLIIAALGAGGYYLWRLRGKKPVVNIFKQAQQKYSEKFQQVSKGLTKT